MALRRGCALYATLCRRRDRTQKFGLRGAVRTSTMTPIALPSTPAKKNPLTGATTFTRAGRSGGHLFRWKERDAERAFPGTRALNEFLSRLRLPCGSFAIDAGPVRSQH